VTAHRTGPPMPPDQTAAFQRACTEYREAVDPHNPWANRRLAVAIKGALDAGWSARAIAAGLRIERKRIPRITAHSPVAALKVPPPAAGSELPAKIRDVFRSYEDEVNLRRINAERHWVATIRAARAAGWPYDKLARLVPVTGERLRVLADMDLDVSDVDAPVFDPYLRSAPAPAEPAPAAERLSDQEKERMRDCAARARRARKTGAVSGDPIELAPALAARKASEELSDLIIAAKQRGITWPELDEACGYARGGARARAARHGYGNQWASMVQYTRTDTELYGAAGMEPPATRKEAP
jgi:hypothetical protein